MRDTVRALSNTGSVATTPFNLEGGLQPTIDLAFPSKNVAAATCGVGASKDSSLRASNEAMLQMESADLIHTEGLPFNLGEQAKFRRLLNLARCVGITFVPQNGHLVGGELLRLNSKRT